MKITLLSTYPPSPATHGGQHRILNVIQALRQDRHDVRSVGILGSDAYPDTDGFLPFPGHLRLNRFIDNSFLMEDWAIGRLAVEDKQTFAALSALIDPNTDAILCEHPWLFAFARKYRDRRGRKDMLLVYESHNIEADLKRQIIGAYNGSSAAEKCHDIILAAEKEAIAHADLITSVSDSDAHWMSELTDRPIVVAPNGVADARVSIADVLCANEITGSRKFALYVASGHPPNVFGFFDLFGEGVGCFSPTDRMVVAGAAGHAIRADAKFAKSAGIERSFIDAGKVSDSALRGLLQTAHCIFIPMTTGGGTNLKTAEALWSGRSVVATGHAMRGFERFEHAPGVHVAHDKTGFLRALQRTMNAPRFDIDHDERERRRSLLWNETLSSMIDAIREREGR